MSTALYHLEEEALPQNLARQAPLRKKPRRSPLFVVAF
jgi:hypothetical protein